MEDKNDNDELEIKPSGLWGFVDTMLVDYVRQPIREGSDETYLNSMLSQLINKGMSGDVESIKIILDRIGGLPTQFHNINFPVEEDSVEIEAEA
jgi:hypothetical protein